MNAMRRGLKAAAAPLARQASTAVAGPTTGYVQQVIGAVVDVAFEGGVPPVLTALTVDASVTGSLLTMEIVQHLDTKTARCVHARPAPFCCKICHG